MNKLLDDLNCSMFMVKNPETKKTEIIIRFINFNSEQEAISFAEAFKQENRVDPFELTNDTTVTIH
tara:strand:+ start:189 stop:386 length:198 start_codon:yes stop_codon:yes gene_type:complete